MSVLCYGRAPAVRQPAGLARGDPKPFLGYSDNTNLHHWLWANGIASFYGGSSQVHLGPGPGVDDVHARSLRAALLTGQTLQITEPGESEDFGVDWDDPRALDSSRPQWILPHGGTVTVDGAARRVTADYS